MRDEDDSNGSNGLVDQQRRKETTVKTGQIENKSTDEVVKSFMAETKNFAENDELSDISAFDSSTNFQENTSSYQSSTNQADPLFRLLNEIQSDRNNTTWDPFITMKRNDRIELDGTSEPEIEIKQSSADISDLIWRLFHIIFCIFVAWSGQNITIRLCSGEILLHTSRFLLDAGQINNSFIYSLAKYVHEPYKTYLSMSARYLRIFNAVYQDLILVLFVYIITWGV